MSLVACVFLLAFLLFPFTWMAHANPYDYCQTHRQCGNIPVTYPFGIKDEGCGDPDFQLCNCSTSPFLNISGWDLYVRNYSTREDVLHAAMRVEESNCPMFNQLSGRPSIFPSRFTTKPFIGSSMGTNLTNATISYCDNNQGIDRRKHLCGDLYLLFDDDEQFLKHCTDKISIPILVDLERFLKSTAQQVLWEQGFLIQFAVNAQRDKKCRECQKDGGLCGYIFSGHLFQCLIKDNSSSNSNKSSDSTHDTKIITGVAVGGGIAILVAFLFIFLVRKNKYWKKQVGGIDHSCMSGHQNDLEAALSTHNSEGSLKNMQIFTYEELRDATNSFAEQNELGDGGSGSVYRGKLQDGRIVAVKRLYQQHSRRVDKFLNEALAYTKLKHPNVVRLYGCTSPLSEELILVFEFVPNGTLADHLHGERRNPGGLPWDRRLKIALQTAEALAFLHNTKPQVLHRDVKSSNILLDEHFHAKVADFGLCRPVPANVTHVTTAPQGTPGYVDPEYHMCYQLTEKSDVYSFGVVLLEIMSGKMAVDVDRESKFIKLSNMAISMKDQGDIEDIIDPEVLQEMKTELFVDSMVRRVAEVAFRCLAEQRTERPTMREVVDILVSLRDEKEQQQRRIPVSPKSVHEKWPSMDTTSSPGEGANS